MYALIARRFGNRSRNAGWELAHTGRIVRGLALLAACGALAVSAGCTDLFARLQLPEKLVDALAQARRITNFEGKRRQMQFIGKLMRTLDEASLQQARDALDEQQKGSAQLTLALHQAEQWRDHLIADDGAFEQWLMAYPATDTQQLRALIRQARKDAIPVDNASVSKGLAPRQGRAYREVFQLVREQIAAAVDAAGAAPAAAPQ